MALKSCDNVEDDENVKEQHKESITTIYNGPLVVQILFMIVVVILILWTFFPSLLVMVLVFLGSLVIAYNNHSMQDIGETVARSGEEPVTRISRTQYSYNTPTDKVRPAITAYDDDIQSEGTRKSSISSRRSSSGKTPSPERIRPDDNIKASHVTTSPVTTSNSIRRSKIAEDDRRSSFTSKYDKFSNASDESSRTSRVSDDKFVSSAVLTRQQKVSDESKVRETTSPSRVVDSNIESEHSTLRDGKYVSSATTTISQTRRSTERTPDSVRRQILTDEEDIDSSEGTRRSSTSSYGKYSNISVTKSTGKDATNNLLESERRVSTGIRASGDSSIDYDDENDGYRTSHYISRKTDSETPKSSRRFSNELEHENHIQKSEARYSSSIVTQTRTVSGGAVTTGDTTSSRSASQNQTIEPSRRRSSTNVDGDRESSPTPANAGFSRITRGGSVRALSQKFQQAAAETKSSDSTHSPRSYPKAGLIFRTSSFRLNNGTSPATTPTNEETPGSTNLKQSVPTEVKAESITSTTQSSSNVETEGKSFLNNQTRVTGVQDILSRMRNAEQDVHVGDTIEDAEARTLLNKFLGAQVILQGMEPLVKGTQSQSAALVSQVERQRVLSSQKISTTSISSSKDLDQDIEEIWDERLLRQLLDNCSDYEGRRVIRARLRTVMAEQKACAGVVAAALADEAAGIHEQEETGQVLRHSVEGESLLLPLLVEQLRNSLLLDKKSTGSSPLVRLKCSYSSQKSTEESQGGKIDDSVTESGENLKLLAAGLRDSIELQRQKSYDKSPQKKNSFSTEPLGPSLLNEVQSALSRLQASLQLEDTGEGQGEMLDSTRKEALLQLVSRLQLSLSLPDPPWKTQEATIKLMEKDNLKMESPEIMLHPPKQAQRFVNKRTQRQNRHTVAVTREELADARRLIEENASKEKLASNSGLAHKDCDDLDIANAEEGDTTYNLVKQTSAGDLALPTDSRFKHSYLSPAMRAFRPVHFSPRHSLPGSTFNANITAKPFFFLSEVQNGDSVQSQSENRRSSCSDINSDVGTLNNGIKDSSDKSNIQESLDLENNSTENKARNSCKKPSITSRNEKLLETLKNEGCHKYLHQNSRKSIEKNSNTNEDIQPMTAVHREYKPGKLGQEWVRPKPISKNSSGDIPSNSKSSTPQTPEGVNTVAEQPCSRILSHNSSISGNASSSSSSNVSSKASTPLRSDSGNSVPEKDFQKSASKSSSFESNSSSKASTPQRSDSGTSVGDRVLHKPIFQSSSSVGSVLNSKGSTPQRSNSGSFDVEKYQNRSQAQALTMSGLSTGKSDNENHVKLAEFSQSNIPTEINNSNIIESSQQGNVHHKAITHSVSLDSTNTNQNFNESNLPQQQSNNRSFSHSVSLDSGSCNYDPSVLLFTPAQSVQIAVHKAAINKQLSLEEEKRQKMNIQKSEGKGYDSEDDQKSDDENGEDVSSENDSDDEEEENTSIRQASINKIKEAISVKKQKEEHFRNEDDKYNNALHLHSNSNVSAVNGMQTGILNNYYSSQCNPKSSDQTDLWYDNRKIIKEGSNPITDNTNVSQHLFQDTNLINRVNDDHQNPNTIKYNSLYNSDNQEIQNIDHRNNNQTNSSDITNQVSKNVLESNNLNTPISVSSAQRLLQMATEEPKTVSNKLLGRPDRKVKMKRANTIDIPKPFNFYEIEEETDYSSGDEYNGNSGTGLINDQHRATYLALRGPIRVGTGTKNLGDKVPPPNFQPRTDSDRKFLAFLQQHSNGKGSLWKGEDAAKAASYNPSARGGHHWSNRFTNIKTAFETCADKGEVQSELNKKLPSSGPAAARMFWQSADDSVTVIKSGKSAAAANGPKLTRQGSIFLRKLFEQKEQEQLNKLPWTDKNVPDDSVVVGSLTVAAANTKGTPGTVSSKKQIFTPPQSPATIHAPVNINKFSHAPMSAFKPIEKKQKSNPAVDLTIQPWATPSLSGTVKQMATQKFTNPSNQVISKPNPPPQYNKQKVGFTPYNQQIKQELLSPVSPTLPWTKDNLQDHRIRNTAVAKFENLSRETSPQPITHNQLPRSRSQEKIAVPSNLSTFVKQHVPIPPPRSYVPPSNTGSLQSRYQEKPSYDVLKQPPPIPTPPLLSAPHLIKNYDNQQHDIYTGYQENKFGEISRKQQNEVPQYSTKSFTTEIDYGTQEPKETHTISPAPQTYSGSVTSRSSVYPKAIQKVPKQEEFTPTASAPMSAEHSAVNVVNVESPDASLPSPEVFMAVSRVMTGPTSHQAVTVSQKTRHRFDEMDGQIDGKSSAAKNLSSVLTKFSTSKDSNMHLQVSNISNVKGSHSPTAMPRSREDEEVEQYQQNASKKSPTIDKLRQAAKESQQNHLLLKSSEKERQSPSGPFIRHHSEPDIKSMISDEQFMEHQKQLQRQVAFRTKGHYNNSGSTLYQHYSGGPNRGFGQSVNAGSVPTLVQDTSIQPQASTRVRPASTESLITTTSTEELQESGESVLTTRLQIPVCSTGTKAQSLAKLLPNAPRSSSLQNVSGVNVTNKDINTTVNPPPSISPSLNLRKSESWHQLAAGQQGLRSKRPQSLALTELAMPSGNVRRVPPSLPKTKSSHSLSFPKQYEATLSPDSVENKQRKVEAYLNTSPKSRSHEVRMKVQDSQNNSLPPPSDMLLLNDSLDNVDEAFESLFNASVSSKNKSISKRSATQEKRPSDLHLKKPSASSTNEDYIPPHLSRSPSSHFTRKQQAWEDSSMVRTKLVQNFATHDRSSK